MHAALKAAPGQAAWPREQQLSAGIFSKTQLLVPARSLCACLQHTGDWQGAGLLLERRKIRAQSGSGPRHQVLELQIKPVCCGTQEPSDVPLCLLKLMFASGETEARGGERLVLLNGCSKAEAGRSHRWDLCGDATCCGSSITAPQSSPSMGFI